MRRAVRIFLAALAAIFALSVSSPAQTLGGLARIVPEETRLDASPRSMSLSLGLSQPVPFRVFALDDPSRIVVDFREVLWDALPDSLGGGVGIETGAALDPGWSRMVLTLDAPMLPVTAAMETDPVTGGAVVRLELEAASAAAFAQEAGWPPGVASGVSEEPPVRGVEDRLIVVIDPGHGGVDPGAVRGEHTEADIVLTFARELAEAVRRTGRAEVVLTREADVFVPLPTRVTIARAAGADAFLSVHADALPEGRARGATVYTLAEAASDAASAALAEQHDRADLLQGVDLSQSDDLIAGVLMDLARMETAPRAADLADTLVRTMAADGLRLHGRPRGEAGFTVLRAADIPSVLLEIGFMSDAQDLENMLDPDWRAGMQDAIVAALLGWADADAMRAALLRQ